MSSNKPAHAPVRLLHSEGRDVGGHGRRLPRLARPRIQRGKRTHHLMVTVVIREVAG